MGLFDVVLLLAIVAMPLLLAITSVQDWRHYHRGRYLVLSALFLFLAIGLASVFLAPSPDLTLCGGAYLLVLILWLFLARARRVDKSATPVP